MSETDDTDDLLLIPPDFFVVLSEPEPPYYTIVDSLIKQVSNLQDRIEGIESMSDVSLVSSYSSDIERNRTMFSSKSSVAKRYYSQDDLHQPNSMQNTPQKLHDKIRMNSLPNTPVINRFSPRKTVVQFSSPVSKSTIKKSEQEESEVLHEIDTFISNVKTIQRNHAVRNLENDFNRVRGTTIDKYNGRNSNLEKCRREQMVRQSQEINTESSEMEMKKDGLVEERLDRVNTWQCGDHVESVPDYGTGVKDHLYKPKESKDLKPTYQPGSSTDITLTNTTLDKSSDSSSESTQLTAFNRSKRQEEFNKFDQKLTQLENQQNARQKLGFATENVDRYKVDQERNKLLHSPLHDNALSVLNMHKQLLDESNIAGKEGKIYKKRSINTLSDNLGLLSLADIWGSTRITQSPGKLSQKLQEENLRRQHCEQLIHDLQNGNLELQQKLAVAVTVDETKNKTIQQFREALDKVSGRMEALNEEKSFWEREITKLKHQHSIELEKALQKATYYEKEASKSLSLAHANQEKIAGLEKRCVDLQIELELIENKFKEVQGCFEKELEKNKQLADIISHKEIELKENKSVLNNAREEVSHSRKAVEVCQNEFTALKNECSRLQSEIGENQNTILNLNEQKRKLTNDLQTSRFNEKTLKESAEKAQAKLDNTKMELRNFYQGQLEIIVENKRKELQNQMDQERQANLEEIKRKELSMAKTAANHIKEISEKCALETKLLEQKHQEEIRLYQMQISQAQKEMEHLKSKLAHLPEKRAQMAKQLQKVMESQWNEALKMINDSPTAISDEKLLPSSKVFVEKELRYQHQEPRKEPHFDMTSDYDETPVSSRGAKQSESEIQKYINMLLQRPPGNPIAEPPEPRTGQTNQRTTAWNVGDLESLNKLELTGLKLGPKERKLGKPPWK